MLDDPEMQGVEQITLSYTFHRAADPVKPAQPRTN
jgi:cytochrome c oxidase assembly protein subunit 11